MALGEYQSENQCYIVSADVLSEPSVLPLTEMPRFIPTETPKEVRGFVELSTTVLLTGVRRWPCVRVMLGHHNHRAKWAS